MREDRVINVFYHERLVGTLAMTNERKAAFEYADEWLGKRIFNKSVFIAT